MDLVEMGENGREEKKLKGRSPQHPFCVAAAAAIIMFGMNVVFTKYRINIFKDSKCTLGASNARLFRRISFRKKKKKQEMRYSLEIEFLNNQPFRSQVW